MKSGATDIEGATARCPAPRSGARRAGVLVIGYGNTLRADDGAGVVVAERLAERLGEGVVALTSHQLVPEMSCDIADHEVVVFVDASVALPPGTVSMRELVPAEMPHQPFGHHLTPEALLAMTGTLFVRVPRAYVMAVGAASFEVGQPLSDAVALAVHQMVERLAAFIVERGDGGA